MVMRAWLGLDGGLACADLPDFVVRLIEPLTEVGPAVAAPLFPPDREAKRIESARVGLGVAATDLARLSADALERLQADARQGAATARNSSPPEPGEASLLDAAEEQCRRELACCRACSRNCGADRRAAAPGGAYCGRGPEARLAVPPFTSQGDERCISPTLILEWSACTACCPFCHRHEALNPAWGELVGPAAIARQIVDALGNAAPARTITLTGGSYTPSVWTILQALRRLPPAVRLPVLGDEPGMATPEHLARAQADWIDGWIVDFKGSSGCAAGWGLGPRYFEAATGAIAQARRHGQVIVRHLLIPSEGKLGHFDCCTRPVLEWLAAQAPSVPVALHVHYRPTWRALRHKGLDHPITIPQRDATERLARDLGLRLIE